MAIPSKPMKAVIFAGGVGTRMWPLSRKSSPKQFEPIVGDKSTLQLSVERLLPDFDLNNIYISTGKIYSDLIKKQLPQIPSENIIAEPVMRDVGPAFGYLMSILAKSDPDCPVATFWSDHLINNIDEFKRVVRVGGEYLQLHPNKIVYVSQKPRFANQNLGWIEYGQEVEHVDGITIHQFKHLHYRPKPEVARKYFGSGHHAWNLGYWILTPGLILEQFKLHAPTMYAQLMQLQRTYGSKQHKDQLEFLYPQLEKISLDDAILEKMKPEAAVVISAELGWSDIGAWEALKEALQQKPTENVIKGNVIAQNTSDSIVYSYTDQLVTVVGLDSVAVVVTKDAILVTKQESIPEVKTMLKNFEGTDLEKYT